jgi:hypothetical protein
MKVSGSIWNCIEAVQPRWSPRFKKYEMMRRNSASIALLRKRIFPVVGGKRCLVIGSAPALSVPPTDDLDVTICVNGSGIAAERLGLDRPDITVMSSNLTRLEKDQRIDTVSLFEGLFTRHLILFSGRGDKNDISAAVETLSGAGYRWEELLTFTHEEYVALASAWVPLNNVLRLAGNRISTGVFSTALLLELGAKKVVLAGFSLSGGHAYLSYATPRNHQKADRRFFRYVARRRLPIYTVSDELIDYGIPRY